MASQPSLDDQFLAKVHKCIEENLDSENFSVKDLAKEVNLSWSMMHRNSLRKTSIKYRKVVICNHSA
jgi:hypothetical protein